MKIGIQKSVPTTLIRTVSSAGTPGQIVTTSSAVFQRAIFMGKKAAQTNNTGDVFVGPASGNGNQALTIATGAIVVVEAPPGQYYDLFDWYCDVVNANDGVVIIYS